MVDEQGTASELYDMRELFRLHGQDFISDLPDAHTAYLAHALGALSQAS